MTFLPIVLRELRVRARSQGTYWFRLAVAMLATAIVTLMLMGAALSTAPGKLGATVFAILSWMAFLFCLVEGARNTADCLSEEKRRGTLGLLFLTDLKGYDVVLGKMVATSLNSFYALLALVPPLAIPFVLGGVTAGEFWRLVLLLIITLFLSLAIGLFVSSVSRDGQRAWTTAYMLIIGLALLQPFTARLPAVKAITPTTGFLALRDLRYRSDAHDYWLSIGGTAALSLTLVIAASLILPRTWHERGTALTRLEQWFSRRHGRGEDRERILLGNPVVWAAQRRGTRPLYAWLVVGAVCAGGLAVFLTGPGSSAVSGTLFVAALITEFFIALWVATEACHLFPNARQSGALELLLCTPVTVKEVIEGHFTALRELFLGPVLTLITMEGLLTFGQIYAARQRAVDAVAGAVLWVGGNILIFALDLHAVARFGMWMGLKSTKPGIAVTKTVVLVLLMHWLFAPLCFIALPIGIIIKDLVFINYSRDQIVRRFRRLATDDQALQSTFRRRPKLPPVLPGY